MRKKFNFNREGMTKLVVLSLFFFLSINFVSPLDLGVDGQIGIDLIPDVPINYSVVNVNNSQFLQGYTPTTLRDFFKTTYDSLYSAIRWNYNQSDGSYNSSYIPYTGANQNVNLGNNNLTINSTTFFVNTNNGKVGIGTTDPSEKLEVKDRNIYINGENSGLIVDATSKRIGFMKYGGKEAGIWRVPAQDFEIGRTTNNLSALGGSSVVDLYIKGDGNVGIGTITPEYKLDVAGVIRFSGSPTNPNDSSAGYLWNQASVGPTFSGLKLAINVGSTGSQTEMMRVDSTGVGIGTTTPQQTLNVKGNGNFTGNLTYNGYYGGMFYHNDSGTLILTNSTYQKLMFSNGDNLNGFSYTTNNTLYLNGVGGLYQAIYKLEGTGTQNHNYHSYVYVNEIQQNNTLGHATGQASTAVDMMGIGFIRINAYDNITVRLADTTSDGTGKYIDGNINLVRVGN